jgi:MerR family transcriptional regulator/heat shock protein HspR
MSDQEPPENAPTGVGRLDDPDYPTFTIGQAADLLGVQQAFLRSLDTTGLVSPGRSNGGHRRYSRRQLELVVRFRDQLNEGHSLASAARIVDLQNDLAAANAEIDNLRDQLRDQN